MNPASIHNSGNQVLHDISLSSLATAIRNNGAVLLRGFSPDIEAFELLTHSLCGDFHVSATRMSRRMAYGDTFSTEVFRDNFHLLGHTEGSYRPDPNQPEVCFFLCITPPQSAGGETLLVDGENYYRALPAVLKERLESEGIIYQMHWGKPRWQAEFDVNNEQALVQYLDKVTGVHYNLHNGELTLRYAVQAVHVNHKGHKVFATGLLAHLPKINHPRYQQVLPYVNPGNKVFWGDGQALDDDDVNQMIDVHDQLAYYHKWQRGDLVIIDNTRVLHGRTMTRENCSRVLISRFGRWR